MLSNHSFERGSAFRILYGKLLDGFNHTPVFRTTSEGLLVLKRFDMMNVELTFI